MKKNLVAWLLAGVMSVSLAASPAVYAGTGMQVTTAVSGDEETKKEEVGSRLGIMTDHQLRKASGLTLQEWDKTVGERKAAGFAKTFTEEGLLSQDPETEILKEEGVVTYIGGSRALGAVKDMYDAYERVSQVLPVLGGTRGTDLRLTAQLTYGNHTIYTFQQVTNSETVPGSVVKLAVKEDGTVSAIFSGLVQGESKEEKLLTEEEAEEAVRAYMREVQGEDAEVLVEETNRIFFERESMETALNLDVQEDPIPQLALWVVYTRNTAAGSKYPYLAHYLRLDGTYEHDLPVLLPNDEESLTGYRKQDVFVGMTADTYTGEVTDAEGNKTEITVPVMHSEEDSRWYLGDAENRIAIADFAAAAYDPEHKLVLVGNEANTGWDNEDLFMFYNYLRAFHFYQDLGWDGPDGQGTDVIILKDLCTSDGTLVENACSIGKIENYSMFGYTGYTSGTGTSLGLVKGLDVMGHEYTHTFTGTVMNGNLYENDLGAINEAMSDIMGNLCEYIYEDSDDTVWTVGENTGTVVRVMSDPHSMAQPEYVWDVFYGPETENPADVNDRGGVHINSSLLNYIGAELCLEGGMSYEEAVRFWTAVAMGLTPRTDYAGIVAQLDWALSVSGNDEYKSVLDSLVRKTKLQVTELPYKLPAGQKVYKLVLPDTEAFEDINWGLIGIQLNTEMIESIADVIVDALINLFEEEENRYTIGEILQKLVDNLHLSDGTLKLGDLSGLRSEDVDKGVDAITNITLATLPRLFYQFMAWEDSDSGEITFVSSDAPTLYLLMNITASGTKINGAALLLGNQWINATPYLEALNSAIEKMPEAEESGEDVKDETPLDEEQMDELLEEVVSTLSGLFEDTEETEETEEVEEASVQAEDQTGITKTGDTVLAIAETLMNLVDYLLTDEEERTGTIEDILTLPAETVYLPTKGLSEIQLIKS